jgi:hypothetical protein
MTTRYLKTELINSCRRRSVGGTAAGQFLSRAHVYRCRTAKNLRPWLHDDLHTQLAGNFDRVEVAFD